MAAYVYWQSYFTNVLPHGQNGVVCILENSCGQSFTYVLHGPQVTYVGQGDMHESKYDGLVVETGYGAFLGNEQAKQSQQDGAQCFYNVRVYPSSEMEDDNLTSAPLFFALGLMAVFLFTSIVFLTYDRLVSRRHQNVETKAIRSSAVVQSLFPEKVRERLYDIGPAGAETKKKKEGFLNNHTVSRLLDDPQNIIDDSMPIADLYPGEFCFFINRCCIELRRLGESNFVVSIDIECTVLFADICGFTKWSTTHTPVEVFQLLETLYATFDKIARKRKVFKVCDKAFWQPIANTH